MSGALSFRPLRAVDLFDLELQPSQRLQYGLPVAGMTFEEAEAHAAQAGNWAMVDAGGAVRACFGITETFAGAQGLAWALIGAGLGPRAHLAMTRFARDEVIGKSELPRIEAIVVCELSPFSTSSAPHALLAQALSRPTPEVRWSLAVGLQPVAVLRKFGAANEPHLLMERIR